jgi:septal ring factor EnvC (AmiA/AmiB activator)
MEANKYTPVEEAALFLHQRVKAMEIEIDRLNEINESLFDQYEIQNVEIEKFSQLKEMYKKLKEENKQLKKALIGC